MKTFINNIRILFLISLISFILGGCGQSNESENMEDEKEGESHDESPSDQVEISEEQFKTVAMQLGGFEQKNLGNTLKVNGVLEVPPQNKATVTSYIGGIIKSISVIQGDYVKKGQTLATLEHPEIFQLQQDYAAAKSALIYQEKEYERQKQLLNENVVAVKRFQQVEADYKTQKALVKSLQGRLQLIGISPEAVENGSMTSSISIKSPINGYVDRIEVNTGSSVDPAKPIFTITDNSYIHADLQVYEKDLMKVKTGQKVYFTLANTESEPFEAVIFAESKSFETNSKSITVHAEIKGNTKKELKPGMYVNGRIVLDNKTVKALPNDAIASEGDLRYIFIRTEPEHHEGKEEVHSGKETENTEKEKHAEHKGEKEEHEHAEAAYTFKKVEVRAGLSDAGYTEVISLKEIPADAQIVTKGAYYLSAQFKKNQSGGEEEHGH
ncbi:MAG: efflux RND transporter periplasmic adaptor subunit [Cytophagaceae bacterium]|nr:efflux RND transporter periplasmic adaptor subunit [Cytophagaceae bacterium]